MKTVNFPKINLVYSGKGSGFREYRFFRGYSVNQHFLFLQAPIKITHELRYSSYLLKLKIGEKPAEVLLSKGIIDLDKGIFYAYKLNNDTLSEIMPHFHLRAFTQKNESSIKLALIGRLAEPLSVFFLPRYQHLQNKVEHHVKELFSGDLKSWNKFLKSTNGLKIDLSGSVFSNANLQDSFFRAVNFSGSTFLNVDFSWAILREAIFKNAVLSSVDLRNAIIREAVFDKLIKGSITILSHKGEVLRTNSPLSSYENVVNEMKQWGAIFC